MARFIDSTSCAEVLSTVGGMTAAEALELRPQPFK